MVLRTVNENNNIVYNKNTILDPNEVDFKKVDVKTYTDNKY